MLHNSAGLIKKITHQRSRIVTTKNIDIIILLASPDFSRKWYSTKQTKKQITQKENNFSGAFFSIVWAVLRKENRMV